MELSSRSRVDDSQPEVPRFDLKGCQKLVTASYINLVLYNNLMTNLEQSPTTMS